MAPLADRFYRALQSRDARFDGRFFIGVVTTGIYCRPICPAPPAKRENLLFFECAAAAEQEGFRPCRRCRPEASPGTPAWIGTSATRFGERPRRCAASRNRALRTATAG